jgi:hypothetical protein
MSDPLCSNTKKYILYLISNISKYSFFKFIEWYIWCKIYSKYINYSINFKKYLFIFETEWSTSEKVYNKKGNAHGSMHVEIIKTHSFIINGYQPKPPNPKISFPTLRNSFPPPGFPLLPLRKTLGKRVPKELFSYPPRHTPYNVNFLGERVPRILKTSVNLYRGVCI